MKKSYIIFDLDGTLINSAPSILSTLKAVFEASNIIPRRQLHDEIIGPPLSEIIRSLLSKEDIHQTDKLIALFMDEYDKRTYKLTEIYEGVQVMLDELTKTKLNIAIATNKRIKPTLSILNYLGIQHYFKMVYTLDYFSPSFKNKSLMLQYLVKELNCQDILYVGDRMEDALAAKSANIEFAMANWGYENNKNYFKILNHPRDLIIFLKNNIYD